MRLTRGDFAAAGVALALLLPGVRAPFWDRDEAEYADAAREMVATGDLLVPSLFGKPYPDKPPLVFWLTAGSFRAFGESEAAGRLPHVLLAACAALLVSVLARRWAAGRSGQAGFAFATALLFVVYGRLLLTDSALLFFTLLSVLALRPFPGAKRAGLAIVGGGIALGLAVLAKGPVAFLVPGLVAAGTERSRRPAFLRFLGMSALAVATAGPWFVAAGARTGGAAVRSFFLRENLERFVRPMEHHAAPFFFPALVVVLGFFPWSGHLFRSAFRERSGGRTALLAWAAGVVLFFSAGATKLPHYVLPAIPALAILLAGTAPPRSARETRLVAWSAAVVSALLFGAAAVAAGRAEFPALLFPAVAALAAVAFLSLVLPLAASPKRPGVFAFHAATAAALIAVAIPPSLERGRCLAALGRAAVASRLAGEPLGGWRIEEPALKYYARAADALKWKATADLARAIERSESRSALVWIGGEEAASIARTGAVSLSILASGDNLLEPGRRGELLLCRARPGSARWRGSR